MLQKIVFQDNIYQLSRSIDIVYEGLMLDLSDDYFFDKTVDDLLFFDAAIHKFLKQLESTTQISGYVNILHSIYSCQHRYILLIDIILSGKAAMQNRFASIISKLQGIRTIHSVLQTELVRTVQKCDKSNDSRDIVSSNELSELLNF